MKCTKANCDAKINPDPPPFREWPEYMDGDPERQAKFRARALPYWGYIVAQKQAREADESLSMQGQRPCS